MFGPSTRTVQEQYVLFRHLLPRNTPAALVRTAALIIYCINPLSTGPAPYVNVDENNTTLSTGQANEQFYVFPSIK